MSHSATGNDSGRHKTKYLLLLSITSGILLGFSFPPSSAGILACFGLIPFLIVLAETAKTSTALKYSYLTFVLFHIITLNWTGGYEHGNDSYMMIAGGVTMLLHPLFYFVPVSLFLFIRKRLGETVGLWSFPFIWVAYEYSHSLSEWSFPWLTIGNSHSYDLARIQFVSYTGVFGVSLWILFVNVLGYQLFVNLARRDWAPLSAKAVSALLGLLLLYMVPKIHGELVLSEQADSGESLSDSITVGIIQPNLDPWEKWRRDPAGSINLFLSLTDSLITRSVKRPDLVLWPETAVPVRLLSAGAMNYRNLLQHELDGREVALVTGFPHMVVYDDSSMAPPSAKRIRSTGERYDDFNAAAFFQPGRKDVDWYGKMKMVPLAERVPYADAFYYLDFLRWGVGIGGWQIGPDTTLFVEQTTGAAFSVMICYESTYPDFVSTFVRKGAEFISVITIDSWWGRMSGAFQHQQFAIFRAIENRRWIARCALGGFSCFIDPYGRVYDKTELFERAVIARTISRNRDLTFYTEHSDLLPLCCVLLCALFAAAAAGKQFTEHYRKNQWTKS